MKINAQKNTIKRFHATMKTKSVKLLTSFEYKYYELIKILSYIKNFPIKRQKNM